jgi:putative transcriptional regulator
MTSQAYIVSMSGPENRPTLGNRLRVARAERDISQDELARMVGVTRQTISSIETGQYCPSALLAFLLARALDQPVAGLFFLRTEGDGS